MDEVKQALHASADPEKAAFFPKFFKTGPGQYGEGDIFIGVTVPKQRSIVKKVYRAISLQETIKLLRSPEHECRLTALFILVLKFQKFPGLRAEIFDLYIANSKYVNNWDLVDSSAEQIVGAWLNDNEYRLNILKKLARSKLLWERRISMIATYHYIRQGRAEEAVVIAEILLNDSHDLIQKAVGWMLREVGKRVDRQLLTEFLNIHASTMPRTTLRYAIEHLSPSDRQHYLSRKQ